MMRNSKSVPAEAREDDTRSAATLGRSQPQLQPGLEPGPHQGRKLGLGLGLTLEV